MASSRYSSNHRDARFERTLAVVQADIKDLTTAISLLERSNTDILQHIGEVQSEAAEFTEYLCENKEALVIKRKRLRDLRREEALLLGDGLKENGNGGSGVSADAGAGAASTLTSAGDQGLHL